MGGKRRNPNDDIFKAPPEPVVKPKRKANQPERPPNIAPAWIDLEELAFGKRKKRK